MSPSGNETWPGGIGFGEGAGLAAWCGRASGYKVGDGEFERAPLEEAALFKIPTS